MNNIEFPYFFFFFAISRKILTVHRADDWFGEVWGSFATFITTIGLVGWSALLMCWYNLRQGRCSPTVYILGNEWTTGTAKLGVKSRLSPISGVAMCHKYIWRFCRCKGWHTSYVLMRGIYPWRNFLRAHKIHFTVMYTHPSAKVMGGNNYIHIHIPNDWGVVINFENVTGGTIKKPAVSAITTAALRLGGAHAHKILCSGFLGVKTYPITLIVVSGPEPLLLLLMMMRRNELPCSSRSQARFLTARSFLYIAELIFYVNVPLFFFFSVFIVYLLFSDPCYFGCMRVRVAW